MANREEKTVTAGPALPGRDVRGFADPDTPLGRDVRGFAPDTPGRDKPKTSHAPPRSVFAPLRALRGSRPFFSALSASSAYNPSEAPAPAPGRLRAFASSCKPAAAHLRGTGIWARAKIAPSGSAC